MGKLYYCYETKTGRYAGSGASPIEAEGFSCTETPIDLKLLDQEQCNEMDWQFKDGKWVRETCANIDKAGS